MNIGSFSLLNVLTTPAASDGAREEAARTAAEDRLRDAKTAVETLARRKSEASEERKAMARRKIQLLKARLQALQGMASANPKGTARLAAQLARELGAAVKAYGAAGGSTSDMAAAVAPSAPAAPTAPGDGTARAQPGSPEAATDDVQAEDKGDKGDVTPANPYQKAIDEANVRAAEASRRGEESRADSEFSGEARRMAAQIKNLIRRALEQSKDEDGSGSRTREADSAVAALDAALADADAQGAGVSLVV